MEVTYVPLFATPVGGTRFPNVSFWRAEWSVPFVDVTRPANGGPHPCPCCGFLTLPERGADDICPVCFWEDDGQDDHDASDVRGGPNHSLSLSEARRNFVRIGAFDERVLPHVRPPMDGERPG